ncbi:Transglutaminase-like superfamily protein [Devosia equisanguinis]|uniref:Transglutaminase-like superfamily protein n=1 Tax=Devosia equisanguinis TaxID=2490941 RepID=A0A447I6G2_9HYPH|nr:transglutaminase family protein [Devosia equisanguinis]VDS03002.1 Transglutaminase-like superfamily protein [Devosia equisanguinis]
MRILVGSELTFELAQPTPLIAILNVHSSRVSDLEGPDHLLTSPLVPVEGYRDTFGNWCNRLVAPKGQMILRTRAVVRDDGLWDEAAPDAEQLQIQNLPHDTLQFLLGSRYCETAFLSETAWNLFGNTPLGRARVEAVVNFVHEHLQFDYTKSRPTRTAWEAYNEGVGVCRDFAHLAITFLRCLNIPTRYCTGYISDIGLPPPYAPQDFAAWIEVFLGGQWYMFDPRNNDPRIGRILIARGRDAEDVPLTLTFGPSTLVGFSVITQQADS